MKAFLNIFISINIILLIFMSSIIGISYLRKREFVYRECHETYPYNFTQITYTREEAKKKIRNLFNNAPHFYFEKNYKNGVLGTSRIFFRLIIMDEDCSIEKYIFAYAHEFIHITECVANDIYAEYKAFVKLYESGDEEFKAVAERHLYWDLKGCSKKNYTFGYYALEYLKHKQTINI